MRGGEPGLAVLAAAFLLTAAGTVAFWIDWFAAGHVATSGTSCYRAFEQAFPLADALLALALVLAAWALFGRRERALLYCFLAAGGIFSLLCLDAAYNLQHGKYTTSSSPAMKLEGFINLHCLILGSAALWYVWKRKDALGHDPQERPRAAGRRELVALAAAFFLVALARLAPLASSGRWQQEAGDGCLVAFNASFALADTVVGCAALLAALGLARRAPAALRSSLFVAGALAFLASVQALFYLENRRWEARSAVPEALTVVAWYALSVWTAFTTWRCRRLLAVASAQLPVGFAKTRQQRRN